MQIGDKSAPSEGQRASAGRPPLKKHGAKDPGGLLLLPSGLTRSLQLLWCLRRAGGAQPSRSIIIRGPSIIST